MLVEITESGVLLKEKAANVPEKLAGCINLDSDDAVKLYELLYKVLGTPDEN